MKRRVWIGKMRVDGVLCWHVCGYDRDSICAERDTWQEALSLALREVGLAPCECALLPEEFHTTHYGATEPGSTHEFNPDCPAHGYDMADDGPTLEPMEAP